MQQGTAHMDEVDLETVAGNVADSLSQIFLLTPRSEVRTRAYEMVGANCAREFATEVERRINAYLQLGNEANDQRSVLEIRKERDAARAMMRQLIEQNGPQAIADIYREELSNTNIRLDNNKNSFSTIPSNRIIVQHCREGMSQSKRCLDLEFTDDSNGEFSDQPKVSNGDFSENGFSSKSELNTFSCSDDDFNDDKAQRIDSSNTVNAAIQRVPSSGGSEFSSEQYAQSVRIHRRSDPNGQSDPSQTRRSSSFGAKFTNESDKEFSEPFKSAESEFSEREQFAMNVRRHYHVSSDGDFSSNKESTISFKVPSTDSAEFSPKQQPAFMDTPKRRILLMKRSVKSTPYKFRIDTREEYRIHGNSDNDDLSSSDDEIIASHLRVGDDERYWKGEEDCKKMHNDRRGQCIDDVDSSVDIARSSNDELSASFVKNMQIAMALSESEPFSDVNNQSASIQVGNEWKNLTTTMDIDSDCKFSIRGKSDFSECCEDDIKNMLIDSENGEFSRDTDERMTTDSGSLCVTPPPVDSKQMDL